MSWFWLSATFVVPTVVGLLVAWLFWSGDDPMAGNVAGAAVVFVALLLIVGREYTELVLRANDCEKAGRFCQAYPRDVIRYMIYTSIAFVDVFIIFITGLRVVERRKRRPGEANG